MKKIALILLMLLVGIVVYVALQPAEFLISRDMLIAAPAEKIFPLIDSSRRANEWMPWKESDPEAVMIYSGPEEGVGSKSSWDSKGQMGTGTAEVIESIPGQVVKTRLTYSRPMVMTQLAEIKLIPSADKTLVRWSVTGESTFFGRLVCTLMNMDKMVGDQFEKGLRTLKGKVEAQS